MKFRVGNRVEYSVEFCGHLDFCRDVNQRQRRVKGHDFAQREGVVTAISDPFIDVLWNGREESVPVHKDNLMLSRKESKMNLKQKSKPGICDRNRCIKQAPVHNATIEGREVALCPSCYQQAKHEGLVNDNGEVVAIPVQGDTQDDIGIVAVDQTRATVTSIIVPLENDAKEVHVFLDSLVIASQDMFDIVSQILQKVKADLASLEESRKSVTKPLLDAKKQVDGWFNPAKMLLVGAEKKIKDKMSEYLEKKDRERIEQIGAGNMTAIEKPTEMISGTSAREVWSFEIYDETQIPRQFLMPDLAAIRKHVELYRDSSPIPGVRSFSNYQIRSGKYREEE